MYILWYQISIFILWRTPRYILLRNIDKVSFTKICTYHKQAPVLSKSHAKTVRGPQNLPKDQRFWGRFCRFPNSLHIGFTFLMDANTSKYFYNYNKANSNKPLKNKRNLWNWEISFNYSWYFYFISVKASIRDVYYYNSTLPSTIF